MRWRWTIVAMLGVAMVAGALRASSYEGSTSEQAQTSAPAGTAPRGSIAPSLRVDGDTLEILTDAAGVRPGLSLHVAATGPGGAVLGETDAGWGARARLATGAWPDGPLEIHITGRDPSGERVFAWLRWYKGDWRAAAARLAAEAAATPVHPVQGAYYGDGHLRFMAALIADQPDNAERAWGVLLEREELRLNLPPHANGFARVAFIDPVNDETQFCRVYLPDGWNEERSWPTVVYLHGRNPDNPVLERWADMDRRHVTEAERYGVIWIEPHGRGNLDWREGGEDDVRRCLAWAENTFKVDPDRVYLTGMSPGGTGVWTIAAHSPDHFAAIAPIVGGPDQRPAGDGATDPASLPVERYQRENQSRFFGMESLVGVPILVARGDRDAPVDDSRAIVTLLHNRGLDISSEGAPGPGRETLAARERVVPWLLSHRRAAPPRVARVRAMNLRDASAWWLAVTEWQRPLEAIEARAEVVEPGVIRLDTSNAAAVRFLLPPALRGTARQVRLIWNGREQRLTIYRDGQVDARLAPAGFGDRKSNLTPGGMSDIFRTPMVVVYGPGAAERAAAERIAAIWRASQHQALRMIPDSEYSDGSHHGYSVLLVGGPRENSATRRLARSLPMQVDARGVTLLGRRFAAPDSVGQMIRPMPDTPGNYLLLVAAASPAAMARWDANSIWQAPAGWPAQPLDWAVGAVMGGTPLGDGRDPSRHWAASGVFGADWGLDPRWTFTGR